MSGLITCLAARWRHYLAKVFSTSAVKDRDMAAGRESGLESSSPDGCQSQKEENILLQLLTFKTHLLEVVEELHIRRDTEERFEEQINKLVLEKQELEWEKESLQHQIEAKKTQHSESISRANKQAKIRNVEEEKSRYQLSAEQKDKDIHNLKEELKSLQLLKYNLEKKSSELEQKLLLQSRSKDSHLNQLGEVEKRFGALSRQCALVKQAHQKLEQNADEAMKLNKNLISINKKQEDTIASLNKEVEDLRKKLVKAKMSCFNSDKTEDYPSFKEQTMQELRQKLNMEYEINRKFKDDNKALQAGKQEVLRSLQVAHQLLANQTQVTSRLQLSLQTQRQQYESLEQDHKAMQGKEKAVEEKIKHLIEEYTVSKNNWDKENTQFVDEMKNKEQELEKVKEALEELHHKHTELSSRAKDQEQQINELKLKLQDMNLSVAKSSSTVDGDCSFNETLSNTELPNSCLTVAKESYDPSDKVAPIPLGGQADCNEGSTNIRSETINTNASTLNEDVLDLNSQSVSAQAAVSVMETNKAQINSSITTSDELDYANTVAKLKLENAFQASESNVECINEDGSVKSEEESRDGDTQKNCGNANDVPQELAVEDGALENNEEKKMTDATDDAAMDATVTEHLDEEHGRVADCDLPQVETQSLTTIVDENHSQRTEDTVNSSQVSHSKHERDQPIQEITRPEVLLRENNNEHCTSPGVGPTVDSPPSLTCRDLEEKIETVSKESTNAELPETVNKSSLCQSQDDSSQLDGVSVQETIKMQTQVVSPPDTPVHVKGTVDNSAKECSSETEDVICPKSQAEIPELKIILTDSVALACETSKNLTNDSENSCENEQVDMQQVNILDKSNLECKHPVGLGKTERNDSQKEFVSGWNLSKSTTTDLMSGPSENELKADTLKSQAHCSPESLKNAMIEESKMSDELTTPIKKAYRSSFDWGSAQRRPQISMTMSDTSTLTSPITMASQMTSSSISGYTGHASATLPMFLRSKHNKFPSAITRTTDLLNGSSVCGTAASSSWRLQATEWKALREAHRDTPMVGPKESRVSQPEPSSSATINKQEEEKSGSWDSSCSQNTEDQQSSFRAQISKIEQFLSTERLRLSKRRKTEN